MSEVRAARSTAQPTRLPRTTAGPATPIGPPIAPPPADQAPAVNVSGALVGGQSGERIEGIVIGVDTAAPPVLRTSAGDFHIETALPLAERSRLVLEIVHLTPVMTAKIVVQDGRVLDPPPNARLTPLSAPDAQAAPETVAPQRAGPRFRLARGWPALDEALSLLATRGAAAPLIAALPSTDDRLGSALLFFFAALRQQHIESWLGDEFNATLAKLGRADLSARLGADFMELAELARGEGTGTWQMLLIPLCLDKKRSEEAEGGPGGQLWPLALFVRHSSETEGGDVRFVIDLSGTAFGPLQLDGLVRTPPRLDLIVRGHLPLPAGMQITLREVAEQTGAGLGYPSRLIFETVPNFPVNPLQDIGGGRAVSDLRV